MPAERVCVCVCVCVCPTSEEELSKEAVKSFI